MLARFAKILMVLVWASTSALIAQAEEAGRVAAPQYTLPENAKSCVADTAFMRRNHMNMLKHQRDETMHKGIRTKKFSLQNCINCHVTKDKSGKPIKVSNPNHFCAACHKFAAVKLDCFECHRSTPMETGKSAQIPDIPEHSGLLADNTSAAKQLGEYLKGVKQ